MCVQDMSALEMEEERRSQVALVSELAELTSVLRENTLEMSRAVVTQNKVHSTSSRLYLLYYASNALNTND